MCAEQKCHIIGTQETHRGQEAVRSRIRGMRLAAEILHEQYGSALFVCNDYICDSTSTSATNIVEIIQAQLNLMVTSVYKPPNRCFSFGSDLRSPQMNVVIGDFNSHSVDWGYISTDEMAHW